MNPASEKIAAAFACLLSVYGPQHWWPNQSGSRWEIITGAILTQNCAWSNVEKALDSLRNMDLMDVESVLSAPDGKLMEAIRPAGFFRQKTRYLKAAAKFFRDKETRFSDPSTDTRTLRAELLQIPGFGPETADSVLLYAFNRKIFVIDAYTRRIAARHLSLDGTGGYDKLQKEFMHALPAETELYREYHALIVAHCKKSCRKARCGEDCARLFPAHGTPEPEPSVRSRRRTKNPPRCAADSSSGTRD